MSTATCEDGSEVTGVPRPSDDDARSDSVRREVWPSVAAICAYILLGVTAYWPVLPDISGKLFSNASDFTQSVWFIGWVPHALAHGLNPFFSNAMYSPTGVNLADNTASPFLGLLTAPLALVWSPLVVGNLLLVLSMPISAAAAFVVLRKWQVWWPAAALGGLVYGFSPYMVGQGLGHVEMMFVPLPPFIVMTVVSILQRQGSERRLGIQLGLLIAVQYLILPEVLASVAVFTFVAVFCVALRHPSAVREMARASARPTMIALGLAAVLLAYPFWMLISGPQHVAGPHYPLQNLYHNDLLSFVVPGPLQKVSLGMRSLGSILAFLDGPTEAGGYIGVPVLILIGFLAWRSRHSSRMQLSGMLFISAVLLSLGPYLAVHGHLTHVPLPFLLLDHIPLINNVLPSRISFEIDACLAAMISFGLDDMRGTPVRDHQHHSHRGARDHGRTAIIVTGMALAVLVFTLLPQWPDSKSPVVLLPTSISRAIPTGDPVAITYPYGYDPRGYGVPTLPLLWQAQDGFRFRITGGYAFHPDPRGSGSRVPNPMSPPNLQDSLAADEQACFCLLTPVSPKLVAATRTALSRYDVRLVIVDRSVSGSGAVMELFDDALGPPKLSAGHFSLWADWHGLPTHQVFPNLLTSVLIPSNGAKLSGTTVLDAAATDYLRVTKVEFLLTDETHHSTLIAGGYLTFYGWVAKWNTTSVADGTYTLQSVAYDSAGRKSQSKGVTITVNN